MKIEELLQHFPGQKIKTGKGYNVQCNVHDDRKPSLSISNGDKGLVLYCHKGCDTDVILEKIGLTKGDLFYENNGEAPTPKKQVEAVYDYKDEHGTLLFQTVRYVPKDFRQRRPDGHGGYVWNLKGIGLVPYNLPDVIQNIKDEQTIFICEGEKDADCLIELGLCATTAPLGAGKWKPEFNKYFENADVVIFPDNDAPGRKHAETIAQGLRGIAVQVKIVSLPGEFKDVFEHLAKNPVDDLLSLVHDTSEYTPTPTTEPEKEPEPIVDVSQFEELPANDLINMLDLTIKKDEVNKLLTFLCMLSSYTRDSQFNISFNAPSSSGKSYIPMEVAKLFPNEDVVEIGYCSPTAFFHDTGNYEKDKNSYTVNLERKILIFLDQPHAHLLERLRPMLSHDKKIITSKITDRTQRHGMRTKNVQIIGYPAVVFCTAALRIDEQEATRFILLSPNINPEKIRAGIQEKLLRETDPKLYEERVNLNKDRRMLIDRIKAVKQSGVNEIKIKNSSELSEMFFKENPKLRPKHQRDIGRVIGFAKSLALLNFMFRERDGTAIYANDEDCRTAFDVWTTISEAQELNLPPYIYDLFNEVIKPLYERKKGVGLTRNSVVIEHYRLYGRYISDWQLRKYVIPILENSGLIRQETDPNDRRRTLIYLHETTENNKGEGVCVVQNNDNEEASF